MKMDHLKAIALDLKEKGINAAYLNPDPKTPNFGLHRISIITPNLTKTYHINCNKNNPNILTIVTQPIAIHIDLREPNSIEQLYKTIQTINDNAL